MASIYQKYIHFLDELRIEKGLKVVDFCENICHDRTYRKYLSGTHTMTQEKLNLFCQKLGFSTQDFYSAYNQQDQEEFEIVSKFFLAVYSFDLEKAKKLLHKIEKIELVNPVSIEYFETSLITYHQRSKKLTDMEAYDQYTQLINYPACLQETHFNVGILFTVLRIAYLECKIGDFTALDFLYSILQNKKHIFINAHTRSYLTFIYRGVSQIYVVMEKWDESLKVAEDGLRFSYETSDANSIQSFHYFVSLAKYALNDIEGARKAARKCLATCIALERFDNLKHYLKIMEKDFGEDPMKYLKITSLDEL